MVLSKNKKDLQPNLIFVVKRFLENLLLKPGFVDSDVFKGTLSGNTGSSPQLPFRTVLDGVYSPKQSCLAL